MNRNHAVAENILHLAALQVTFIYSITWEMLITLLKFLKMLFSMIKSLKTIGKEATSFQLQNDLTIHWKVDDILFCYMLLHQSSLHYVFEGSSKHQHILLVSILFECSILK